MLLNLLKLIITLSFLLNYTTKLQKSPALWGIFIRIRGYFVPTAISLPYKIVLKTYNGYMTPFRYYPIIFKEDERGVKGKELVSNKELKFLLGRKKNKNY